MPLACAIGVAIFQPSSSASSPTTTQPTAGYHWALLTLSAAAASWKVEAVHVYQIVPIPTSEANAASEWEENHLVTSLASLPALLGIIQITAFKPHSKAKGKGKERAVNREPEEDQGLGQGDLDAYIRELGPGQDGYNTRGRGWGPLAYVVRILEGLREAELLPLRMTMEEMIMEGEALGAKLEHLRAEGTLAGVPVVKIGG